MTFRSRRPDPPPPGAGPAGPPRFAALLARPLALADALFARAFGSRWNPIHQTGNLAVLFLLATVATGVYLFLFFQIDDPHGSIERIRTRIPLGGWVRSLHRYAADLAVVATALHLVRKLVQGQTWGPRALAWTSGVALLGLLLLCGWTGLILVWDAQGLELAHAGARFADLLPLFSTPIARTFTGGTAVPSSFFFMNLFLHVALPLGLVGLFAVHMARIARPALLPPRRLVWLALGTVAAVAALLPVPHSPEADLLALPGRAPLDLFFAFWLPLARRVSPAALLALWGAAGVLALLAPKLWRPRTSRVPQPINTSWVDEQSCTGCTDCAEQCPYEAIAMVPRSDFTRQRSELVARVAPDRCVGCGICAGACAPMGVGPFGRTGRDQLAALDPVFSHSNTRSAPEILVFACRNSGWDRSAALRSALADRDELVPLSCAGSLHSAAIESSLRRGAGGVLVLACPPRDCRFREGSKWTELRLFHGREAELPARVDRTRVAFAALSPSESGLAVAAIAQLRLRARALEPAASLAEPVEPICATANLAEVEELHA